MTINQLLDKISHIAIKHEIEIYPVGGFVRDRILKIESKDIDFVVIGNGIAFAKELSKQLKGKHLTVFKNFGTAHFKLNDYDLEFVTARKESYRGSSRKPIVEATDLQTDLSRRDFTINAMAMHIKTNQFGELIDPYNGQNDLKHKIIRTPLNPDIAFNDDPLRILRAVRFASRFTFKIDPDTMISMKNHADRLKIVSIERILEELKQIFESNCPDYGLSLLNECDVIRIILPELVGHINDLTQFIKSYSFENLQFQDILAVGFAIHKVPNRQLKKISKRMRFSNEMSRFIANYLGHFEQCKSLLLNKSRSPEIKRFLYSAAESYFHFLQLTASYIDSTGQKQFFEQLKKEITRIDKNFEFSQFKLALDGHKISATISVSGKQIGKVKNRLTSLVLNEELDNNSDELLKYIRTHQKELISEINPLLYS